ncbi:DgyrCDS8937 [Dimorphilus gyrociliatus]|uniref:DgyrCDS8937 n=1 Tax=Dimorphilus gyrociliatus TaxID=2664684 RepID=A0A7I8VXX8_9ANNE|nr:DgyrCDS8937 [Dimorphilus gyrociliatus]
MDMLGKDIKRTRRTGYYTGTKFNRIKNVFIFGILSITAAAFYFSSKSDRLQNSYISKKLQEFDNRIQDRKKIIDARLKARENIEKLSKDRKW